MSHPPDTTTDQKKIDCVNKDVEDEICADYKKSVEMARTYKPDPSSVVARLMSPDSKKK